MDIEKYVASDLLNKFEFYNYGHALEILHHAFPKEWSELQECLRKLKLSIENIRKSGGNESPIPKKFDDVLYPYGWREIRISGDLTVKKYPRQTAQRRGRFAEEPYEVETIKGYIDGHNIDFLKNRVAFDLEWNSKDQTFDREKGQLLIKKYGASTTWMGKLLYRLDSRRNGGCPVLAIGIGKECIEEYGRLNEYDTKLEGFYEWENI